MTYSGPERRQRGALSFLETLTHEELLEYAMRHSVDQRTGLLDLDAFTDAVQHLPASAFPGDLLVLDIVGLKALNKHGRSVGNRAIAEAGRAARLASRGKYLSSRIGGDEIGIYAGSDPHAVHDLRSRIQVTIDDANMIVPVTPGLGAFWLEARYGTVTVQEPTRAAIDWAIHEALEKAYHGVPATPRS